MSFERTDSREAWSGRTFSVHDETFRYDGGRESQREIVRIPDAVAVVAHDGDRFFMVAQPREAVDDPALLELPAGRVDEGESPIEAARRELAEEIGRGAETWKHLTTCYSSPGFTDEVMHVYLATDLYEDRAEAEDTARIEVRAAPLSELDETIASCRDAASLVGLLWLRAYGEELA
jgi:ADP-ribose pyrophosphatase